MVDLKSESTNKFPDYEDSIGAKNNYLTVIGFTDIRKNRRKQVVCMCKCGNETIIPYLYFKNGVIKSCGCLTKEINTKRCKEEMSKHNKSGSRLHNIWKNIRQRCNNPKASGYKNYGGRGITYCEEWNDFLVFEKWALENGYEDNLTIDRIDNDKNYCPENCQWLTKSENTIKRNKKR